MSDDFIEIKIANNEVNSKLLKLSEQCENLRLLMKNIAGIFASSTEDNFREEGIPKWQDLSEATKKYRKKIRKYPGQILQVNGNLASSITTYYDNDSAMIGSNLPYAAIHQLGGLAGKNKKVEIPARPYLKLNDDDFDEIIKTIDIYIIKIF